jgi:hypothetical protein
VLGKLAHIEGPRAVNNLRNIARGDHLENSVVTKSLRHHTRFLPIGRPVPHGSPERGQT